MGCVYKLEFPNGKHYVGITKHTALARFNAHVKHMLGGKRLCAVHSAIRKYGAGQVTVTTLLRGDDDFIKYMEPRVIAAFGTKCPNGYNLTDGGEGAFGVIRSQATKDKISAAKVGRSPISPEHVARLKAINTGRVKSADERARISIALTGKKKSAAQVEQMRARSTGKKLSAEAKAKVSAFNKGKAFSDATRQKISDACRARWVERRALNSQKHVNVNDVELESQ